MKTEQKTIKIPAADRELSDDLPQNVAGGAERKLDDNFCRCKYCGSHDYKVLQSASLIQ